MKLFGKALALMVLAAIPALLSAFLHPNAPELGWSAPLAEGEIRHADAIALDGVLWVDARAAEAFHASRIPGAILLNEDGWEAGMERFFEAWFPGQPVVIYCDSRSCAASHQVAERLQKEIPMLEEGGVYVLHGGWAEWKGPVEP